MAHPRFTHTITAQNGATGVKTVLRAYLRIVKIVLGALLIAVVTLTGMVSATATTRAVPVKVIKRDATWAVEAYAYAGTSDPDQQLTATYALGRRNAPWVVTIHGGSWYHGSQANTQNAVNLFSRKGWQVFNLSYRMGDGITFADQLADMTAARDWIKAHAQQFGIDPNRGTAYGFSAGGHLAAELGVLGGFRDVVSLSGVLQPHRVADDALGKRSDTEPTTDGYTYLLGREEAMVGCAYSGIDPSTPCGQAWRAFCPEFQLGTAHLPFYIVQGAADTVVPPASANAFAYHVRAAGGQAAVTIVPGYGHDDREVYASPTRQEAMLQWVAAHAG